MTFDSKEKTEPPNSAPGMPPRCKCIDHGNVFVQKYKTQVCTLHIKNRRNNFEIIFNISP